MTQNNNQLATDEHWMGQISAWADEYKTSEVQVPRNQDALLALTSLSLRSNSLDSLPNCIGKLSNLTSLDVSGNNLDSLPDCIGKLRNLVSLDISYNNIGVVPENIDQSRVKIYL